MSKLIAIVATAVIVNGERVVIPAGDPLPELGEHDSRALTGSGAALDEAAQAKLDKADVKADKDAQAPFRAARERVQAEAASTASDAATPAKAR